MKVLFSSMAYRRWVTGSLISALLMVGLVVACGVEDVKATDYNQSCSKDDDCILVDQLAGNGGTDCTIPCDKGAINRKDKDKYDKEFEEEKGSCTTEKRAECTTTPIALCKEGKCTQGTLSPADAGTD